MENVINKYLQEYGLVGDESEEKRIRNLLKKLHENDSIFCFLPFDYLSENEQITLLNYILNELPERQIIANMNKVDVDRDYNNFVFRKPVDIGDCNSLQINGYKAISLAENTIESRLVIREPNNKIEDILCYLNEENENIIREYIYERQQLLILGYQIDDSEYVKEYIDYVANILLQLLVYKIIAEKRNSLDVMKALIDKIDELKNLISKQLIRKKDEWKKDSSNLSTDNVTSCFTRFVTHRSRLYEEQSIKQVLVNEMNNSPELFSDVLPKYGAKKELINENDINSYKDIITEGLHVDRYKEKIDIIRRFIDIMAIYGGRQCYSLCVQDIKVYFREVFLSKSSYKRRMASRIVQDYLDKYEKCYKEGKEIPEFDKDSQYMFVREKITRGYFREKGLAREYVQKTVFEKKLYDLLLDTYLFYNIYDSLEFIYEINHVLLHEYMKLLEV